jgi:hypothetical protein
MDPRYPEIAVRLTGQDGNAMNIITTVTRALRHYKVSQVEIEAFVNEAMSGGYDKVLATCMAWVDVS